MSIWYHPVCDVCWRILCDPPHREPVRMLRAGEAVCCGCGAHTTSGIFIRADPNRMHCRGKGPSHSDESENKAESVEASETVMPSLTTDQLIARTQAVQNALTHPPMSRGDAIRICLVLTAHAALGAEWSLEMFLDACKDQFLSLLNFQKAQASLHNDQNDPVGS